MIRIITIENPFDPRVKDIREQVCTNTVVSNYVETDSRDIFLNGRKINDPAVVIPQDHDEIISIPHIANGGGLGKILGFVATIALTVYSGGIAAGAWGANAFWGAVEAGAVMYLGGRLINAVFPQAVNNAANLDFRDNQTSQTYGWDLPTVSTVEGGIVGRTYGTCIPQAQLLSEHVETIDDVQYLNLLYCGGYGEIDSIDNIRIDNTPISCFSGVQIETRLGTNTQLPISFFKDTPIDESIGLLLDLNKPLVRTTSSNKASALEVTFEFPSGLYHVADSGAYDTATITIQVQYRKTGNQDWIYQNKYAISNASSDSFRKAFKWNVSDAGQYDVQVMITDKPTGSRYSTYCQWSMLTAYNTGIYSRPGKVLLGLRILATNQLSGGVPNVNWRQTRSKVYVYNPHTGAYETKAANNPIWAAYDILHQCEYIEDSNTHEFTYIVSGCKHDALDDYYEEWQAAADYADEMILNHDGVSEKRYQFDAFYDTEQKRYDAATKAAVVGHSNIIIHGRKYGIVTDRPSTVCQIFGEGRTKLSSVSGSFTSKDERAKAIEITYNDADNDYKNTQFTLRSDDFGTSNTQDNTAQLTLFGVARRSQAYREAIKALATNERQLQSVELSTDIDGITAEYGDVIGYTHAISKIGIASGRIVSGTATTVKLDKTVDILASKTYEIYVQLSNDKLVKRDVVPVSITTDTLTVTQPFDTDDIPQLYDCYSFGETNKAIKPFRITGAERDGDLLCKLKLVEYDEAVYATELDYSKYPKIDYTSFTDNVTKNVTAYEETYVSRTGDVQSYINVAWDIVEASNNNYSVLITDTNLGTTQHYNVNSCYYRYSNAVVGHTYEIEVRAIVDGITVGGEKTSVYIVGKDTPPSDVSFFSLNQSDSDIVATIQQVSDYDIDHYEIRMGTDWDTAYKVGDFTGTSYSFAPTQNGTCTYLVKAFDTSGNESKNAKKQVINISNVAATNVIYSHQFDTSNYESYQNLYDHNGVMQMIDARKISDFEYFKDIFGQLAYLDGAIYLPVIDLGENIVDPVSYWIDSKGIIHQQEIKKIKDYETFADIFNGGGDLVAPVSLASTFLTIMVNGTISDDILKTIEYRVSIDGYTYTDWTPAIQTIFKGRYVQIRITISSVSTHTQCYINNVDVKIDVPDIEIPMENIDLIAGDNYVAYSHYFMETPSSIAPFTTDTDNKSVSYKIPSADSKGFHILLYDDNNNLTAGKITCVKIRGY